LEAALEREKAKVETLKQEADVKIKALQKQAATASQETRTRIERCVLKFKPNPKSSQSSVRLKVAWLEVSLQS
jgi:hypothetical protein